MPLRASPPSTPPPSGFLLRLRVSGWEIGMIPFCFIPHEKGALKGWPQLLFIIKTTFFHHENRPTPMSRRTTQTQTESYNHPKNKPQESRPHTSAEWPWSMEYGSRPGVWKIPKQTQKKIILFSAQLHHSSIMMSGPFFHWYNSYVAPYPHPHFWPYFLVFVVTV